MNFIEQDKENDSRNAQATQAVIQRRRRPKRRSTGVVHVDMDVSIQKYIFYHKDKCVDDPDHFTFLRHSRYLLIKSGCSIST